MSQLTLLRYNFRVMMLNNWWLIVFPIAVSQLTVFWILITREYSSDLPTASVELITPLLGAFLGAHLLSAEYRSRVGAVLASRPVNISRIVVLRLLVMLVLVWGLAILSLMAYTYGKQPFDLKRPIVACIPSTLFLSMLALTFATLFRNSLAGFGIAALYWAMDLMPGPPLQPYMSLRSLTSYYLVYSNPNRQTFVKEWWISKIILLVAAVLLYLYHSRIVFTLGSSLTVRLRRRTIIAAASLLIVYLVSGALLRVVFGYANRGKLPPNDLGWFRHQFAPFGPVPVASLFGSDFARYVGDIGNPWKMQEGEDADVMGDSVRHRKDLQDIVDKSPNSPWAASAADAVARLEARRQHSFEEAAAYHRRVVDRYPKSPYVDYSLRQIARLAIDAKRPSDAESAYNELLTKTPESSYRAEALRYLVDAARTAGRLDDAEKRADQWTRASSIEDRFEAWARLAEVRKDRGDMEGAKAAAKQALTAVAAFRRAFRSGELDLGPQQKNIRERVANSCDEIAQKILAQ